MWDLFIFDLDGTLIDSRRDIAAGVNHAISGHAGFSVAERRIHPHIGAGLRGTFTDLVPGAAPETIDAMVAAYKEFYFENCDVHTRVYPGVLETLAALDSAPRAIATSKRSFMARRVAERFGLDRLFDLIRGTDEGTPLKPAPDLLVGIMEHFGARPERTLTVGDTDHDVLAGKAAGCRTVAVTYGIRSREELKACRPDALIDSFPELAAVLATLERSRDA